MYEEITSESFEELMNELYQKEIWITVIVPLTTIHLYYPEFEFLSFETGEYQFGTEDVDSVHLPFSVKTEEINSIHRDVMLPTLNSEQVILKLNDGEIIIESNC